MAIYLLTNRKNASIIVALIMYSILMYSILALQGCATLTGPRVEQPLDDKTVAQAIKDKMASDPDLSALKIDVTVKRGEAVLSGVVPSRKVEVKLIKLVLGISGVKSVKDNITVKERRP